MSPPESIELLAAEILSALGRSPSPSQRELSARLGRSASDVAKALRLLGQRRAIERYAQPGVRGLGIRLVAAIPVAGQVVSIAAAQAELAALIASGHLVVTEDWVCIRRRSLQ